MLTNDMKNLLSKRSGTAARILLNLMPMPRVPPKPQLELILLSMCGVKHLGCLQQSLLSLYMAWSSLPKLQIVSDGSLTFPMLEKAFDWWPGTKSFSSWTRSVAYHQQKGRDSLVKFGNNNLMGRKLAIILEFAERGATLWCDSDILWFRELSSLPEVVKGNLPTFKMSEDYNQSYDKNLIKQGLEHLCKPPFMCAGLIFLEGDLIQACDLNRLLDIAATKSNWFTEQTIFAEAAYQLGRSYWPREKIAIFDHDQLSLKIPTYFRKDWVARHYVGPVRHIFWRDALALRLMGIQKKG